MRPSRKNLVEPARNYATMWWRAPRRANGRSRWPVGRSAVSTFALVGATTLTMADPPIVHDATIVIEDGRIAGISTHGAAPKDAIDARGTMVLPGLVNAHAHTLESFLRGCGGQLTLLPWI